MGMFQGADPYDRVWVQAEEILDAIKVGLAEENDFRGEQVLHIDDVGKILTINLTNGQRFTITVEEAR